MALPPLPEPYADGGPPQSQIAPGDTGRELLHEIKNLSQAVALLGRYIQHTRRRQRQAVIFFAAAVAVLAVALGYSRYVSMQSSRASLTAAHAACASDSARGAVEIEILQASLTANKGNPRAQAFFGPRIAELVSLQKDCDKLYPTAGSPDWPRYWQVP